MKKSNKQSLAKRGVIVAGRAPLTPGASVHKDARRPDRSTRKREDKRHIQIETARTRGPFPFLRNTTGVTLAEFDALYANRHEPENLTTCVHVLENVPSDEFAWEWRRARLLHFRGMQTQEVGDERQSRDLFGKGAQHADIALRLDGSRVEGAFWGGTCHLEAARSGGKFALLATLGRAHKAIELAARLDEEFHFAGPLRVLGRITHQKPLALGGSLDRAIAFYDRALQIAPRNSTTGLYLADALLADRQPKRAREVLNAVIENSDAQNWMWETARDQEKAREWLKSRFD